MELLRNAGDVSRAARGMVGDMVQTVSRVLDMADGDPLNVAKEMMYGTYSVATRGAGLALDLTTIVLGVRGLKTQTRRAADGVSQRVNATIDGFLRGFQFTPPVLAGKPRPNILGSAKTFQWTRPDGTTDTHHVWFEGTRDGKVTLHIASVGGEVATDKMPADANELKVSISKVERAFQSVVNRLNKRASSSAANTYDKKVHSGRTLRGLLGKALQDFVDIVEQMKTAAQNRQKARLLVRLENTPDIGKAINYSHREDIGVEVVLKKYLDGFDKSKYVSSGGEDWGKYMEPLGLRTDILNRTKEKAERDATARGQTSRIHAHHIVMQKGHQGVQATLVEDTKTKYLAQYNLGDSDRSAWNLVWAPNRGHSDAYTRNIKKAVEDKYKSHQKSLDLSADQELAQSNRFATERDKLASEMKEVIMKQGRQFFNGTNT